MNITAFKYFVSVVDCLNFSEAAEKNYISQSSLSKAIISLEKELQVTLFDRNSHPIKVTPAGKFLYERIKEIEPVFMHTMRELSNYSECKSIRCFVIPNSYAIRSAIEYFQKNNPDITVFADYSSDYRGAVDAVMNHDYDFVITHRPLQLPHQVKETFLYDDILYALVATENSLSDKKSISLQELDGKILLETPFSRSVVSALSELYHFIPQNILPKEGESITREEILHRVSFNQGVSIYCGRDISIYKQNRYVTLKLEEVPSFPMVVLSKGESVLSEWHIRFIQFLISDLEKYVGKNVM